MNIYINFSSQIFVWILKVSLKGVLLVLRSQQKSAETVNFSKSPWPLKKLLQLQPIGWKGTCCCSEQFIWACFLKAIFLQKQNRAPRLSVPLFDLVFEDGLKHLFKSRVSTIQKNFRKLYQNPRNSLFAIVRQFSVLLMVYQLIGYKSKLLHFDWSAFQKIASTQCNPTNCVKSPRREIITGFCCLSLPRLTVASFLLKHTCFVLVDVIAFSYYILLV